MLIVHWPSLRQFHPLTQAAARSVASDEEIQVSLAASSTTVPSRDYPFAIYQWQLLGLKEDSILVPVLADEDASNAFMELLAHRN